MAAFLNPKPQWPPANSGSKTTIQVTQAINACQTSTLLFTNPQRHVKFAPHKSHKKSMNEWKSVEADASIFVQQSNQAVSLAFLLAGGETWGEEG